MYPGQAMNYDGTGKFVVSGPGGVISPGGGAGGGAPSGGASSGGGLLSIFKPGRNPVDGLVMLFLRMVGAAKPGDTSPTDKALQAGGFGRR
jgi:hypothetical protein